MNIFLPSLLPSLALLFSHIFMWSNNAHMFSNQSLAVSFLIILVISVLVFGINYFLVPRILEIIFPKKWNKILFYTYIALLFIFFLACIVDFQVFNQRRVYAPIILLVSFAFIYLERAKILVIFLSVMICFSSVTLLKNSILENEIILSKKVDDIILRKKPNIYLYWLESYHDFDILKKVYNIDSEKYKNYLYDKSFIIGENIFSSGRFTLAAFTQLYSCSQVEKSVGNLDVERASRGVIGGEKGNVVFRILKNNGYKTILLAGSFYYVYAKGEYLDELDIEVKGLYNYVYPLCSIYFENRFIDLLFTSNINKYKGSLFDRVKTAMMLGKESTKPYIIAFKGGAAHTPPNEDIYTWKDREKWISSNTYQDLVKKSNIESEEIINYILENDPNALIVLLGDHGALTYTFFPWNDPESYAKYNVREEDVFDDLYRVLLAYRLPGGAQDDIAHGMYMNNVNIFTHIFAYLADDPSLLEQRTPSVSVLGKAKMVDGKLVRE